MYRVLYQGICVFGLEVEESAVKSEVVAGVAVSAVAAAVEVAAEAAP